MVEHDLAKVGVAGSSPVFRSRGYKASCHLAIRRFSLQSGLRAPCATGFLLHNPRCGAFPQGKYCGALVCPDGGIGRRVGLKHQWGKTRTGSIPVPGTALLSLLILTFIGNFALQLVNFLGGELFCMRIQSANGARFRPSCSIYCFGALYVCKLKQARTTHRL